ncbi:hypothetical protein [Nonomuraea sp. SYSU D8015]|uniref:hypothetical protein n=1 Tax=Nonomuraea sp. SYSU D8015 TaxID=2593644 RepID=UPI0016613893|nr:hypothetical protein [Nonomuraea sp. SYSU D8015]
MVIVPGTCAEWHQDPRPMLRQATLDDAGPQSSVHPRKVVDVLCDDGQWHPGVLDCWHQGRAGLDCHIEWSATPYRRYMGWFRYSPAAIRLVDEN